MQLAALKGDEKVESDDELASYASDDEVEREEETQDDVYKTGRHLHILPMAPPAPLLSDNSCKALDMATLTEAFTKLAKARKVQGQAYKKIAEVLSRNPEMATLAQALEPMAVESPFLPSTAVHVSVPPTKKGTPQVLAPISDNPPHRHTDGINWACHYCEDVFTTWDSADSHTRKRHTGVKYGPCPECLRFTTFSSGSFRGHKITCRSLMSKKRRMETKFVRPLDHMLPEKRHRVVNDSQF